MCVDDEKDQTYLHQIIVSSHVSSNLKTEFIRISSLQNKIAFFVFLCCILIYMSYVYMWTTLTCLNLIGCSV